MRIAKLGKQDANLFERELTPGLAGSRVELGHHAVELGDGLGVRHEQIKYRRGAMGPR